MSRDWIAVEVDQSLHNPRRPYEADCPEGYLESDRDWVENNMELCIQFLNSLERRLGL